jgi:hypothetical protein
MLTKILHYFLSFILPNRIKRMIYLSSLAPILLDRKPDISLASELNSNLRIASNYNALLLPMYLSRYIWNDTDMVKHNIIDHVPFWLKYGCNCTIRNDLNILAAI